MVEADPRFPDARAAAELVKKLNAILPTMHLDDQPLLEEAQLLEEQLKSLLSQAHLRSAFTFIDAVRLKIGVSTKLPESRQSQRCSTTMGAGVYSPSQMARILSRICPRIGSPSEAVRSMHAVESEPNAL